MYKVFFKENCFLLTDDANLAKNGKCWIHKDFNETQSYIQKLLEKQEKFEAVLYHEDLAALFATFQACFIYVKAAGGIVYQDHQILLIKRLGMYDLPKGHLEFGETPEQCAVREVEEECGLRNLHIVCSSDPTWHIYFRHENWHLKKTYWFRMSAPVTQPLTPQTEEDIEDAFWFPADQIEKILDQTYPSLIPVLLKAQREFR